MATEAFETQGNWEIQKRQNKHQRFHQKLSKEWAAFPKNESNESYYKGVGNNKALVSFKSLKDLLEKK